MIATLKENKRFSLKGFLPAHLKENLFLQYFGLTKVPVLFFLQPRLMELNEEQCIIKIPLNWRSKNHLNSMYFGALAAGADCAGGFMAMNLAHLNKEKISLAFKDFKADFKRRAEGDVYFVCNEGLRIKELMAKASATGERQNMLVKIEAFVPTDQATEPVAEFELTLSVKRK